jgi:hypothetical protein
MRENREIKTLQRAEKGDERGEREEGKRERG